VKTIPFVLPADEISPTPKRGRKDKEGPRTTGTHHRGKGASLLPPYQPVDKHRFEQAVQKR